MIQVAIVGCGVIGPVHAAATRLDADASVRWACDLDPAKRGRVAAERQTGAVAEVLADPQVDLVAVCTQHPAHADVVVAALAAGKHVICEKPLASTPADLRRMLAAAAGRPRQVASGIFQHRFAPLARRLRQLVAEGAFGRIASLDIAFACTRDESYYASGAWRGKWDLEGGGVAINQGIHTLDLGLWLAGAEPLTVSAQVRRRRLACIEVEDWLKAEIACRGGLAASFLAENDGVSGWKQQITIRGDRGAVVLGDGHRLLRVEHPSGALAEELRALDQANLDGRPLGGGKDVYGYHHALQVADVFAAIRAGRPPMVTFADAITTNEVVLACYHSQATAAPAAMPLESSTYRTPVLPLEQKARS